MNNRWLGLALLGPAFTLNAYSEVYLTDAQAAKILLPGEPLERVTLELLPAEKVAIEKSSNETVRASSLVLWKGKGGGIVFIDQVLGKHELITYAVGIARSGKISGVEILEYRESYGQQVRNEAWRKQFAGKAKDAPLKLNEDIKNIGGATLSSAHVTAGVKRILHTYDTIKSRI